jgi:hypothetical protein
MGRKRCVFVLATADYRPELCALTLPNVKRYADRLGADFVRIQERKLPNCPLTFERMQIYELGHGNEWNVCIDADVIMSPHPKTSRQVCHQIPSPTSDFMICEIFFT